MAVQEYRYRIMTTQYASDRSDAASAKVHTQQVCGLTAMSRLLPRPFAGLPPEFSKAFCLANARSVRYVSRSEAVYLVTSPAHQAERITTEPECPGGW